MSHDGRASANAPDPALARKPADHEGSGAAGTFPPRLVERPGSKPIDLVLREGLRRLIEFGKLSRRRDGGYGTHLREIIPNVVATQLKARHFAVAGFNREIVPTEKGRRVNAGAIDAPQSRGNSNHG